MAILSDAQVDAYERDGYLVIEGFVSRAACDELREAAEAIVDAFEPGAHRSVFTTNEQTRHSDDEFLASASRITCFFEEEALDADGRLRVAKARSINKIGHAQHDLDPAFRAFTYSHDLAGVAADLGQPEAVALQSMYIFKQPSIGGEVGCHQDATFLYTDPITVTGYWFAIEDATLDNGCLWAEPGGHRGPLRRLFRRAPAGGTEFAELDPTPLPTPPTAPLTTPPATLPATPPATPPASAAEPHARPTTADPDRALVPLPVAAGTLVVLHGRLPHWSGPNRSPRSRHAYSVHAVEPSARYPAWNWLQRDPGLAFNRLDGTPGTRPNAGR